LIAKPHFGIGNVFHEAELLAYRLTSQDAGRSDTPGWTNGNRVPPVTENPLAQFSA
jgi:hypothetical protein